MPEGDQQMFPAACNSEVEARLNILLQYGLMGSALWMFTTYFFSKIEKCLTAYYN